MTGGIWLIKYNYDCGKDFNGKKITVGGGIRSHRRPQTEMYLCVLLLVRLDKTVAGPYHKEALSFSTLNYKVNLKFYVTGLRAIVIGRETPDDNFLS